jgi:hypothetical protein
MAALQNRLKSINSVTAATSASATVAAAAAAAAATTAVPRSVQDSSVVAAANDSTAEHQVSFP